MDDALAADLASTALATARRFHAGATLWCLAPRWEPHAQHVAVEFVHPVIVGKRALPAVALTGPDLVATARISIRPGDLVLAVAEAADPDVRSIMRRAPAWGATTIWIGSGPRPDAGAADHVLWLDDPDPLVPATGRFVLLYHLLWELTHVCFEHPGLLTEAECTDEVCITCSDAAVAVTVLEVRPGELALVDTGAGPPEEVSIALVDAGVGDVVLVHAGEAIAVVTPDDGAPKAREVAP